MSSSKYQQGNPGPKEYCDNCGEDTERPASERFSCDDCDREILCEDCWMVDPHYSGE